MLAEGMVSRLALNGSPRLRAVSPALPGPTRGKPAGRGGGVPCRAGRDLEQAGGAGGADHGGAEARFLERVGEDQGAIDPPPPARRPIGPWIAGGEVDAGAARRAVGEPI